VAIKRWFFNGDFKGRFFNDLKDGFLMVAECLLDFTERGALRTKASVVAFMKCLKLIWLDGAYVWRVTLYFLRFILSVARKNICLCGQ
jgi:hypothetical protein